MKKLTILFVFLLVSECLGVDWVTSREEAKTQANAECKRILLVAGRESCGNCRYMKYTVMESAGISNVLEDHFVCWFCDVDASTEWYPYAGGLVSFYLPLISVIEPEDPHKYLARSTGVVYANAFSQWIDPYVVFCVQNNLVEFVNFAQAWLAVSDNENYDGSCDLDHNNVIDIGDLVLFGVEWLQERKVSG